jgi:hypothetical protein
MRKSRKNKEFYSVYSKLGKRRQGVFPFDEVGLAAAEKLVKLLSKGGEEFIIEPPKKLLTT